jgi:hypothetical protein
MANRPKAIPLALAACAIIALLAIILANTTPFNTVTSQSLPTHVIYEGTFPSEIFATNATVQGGHTIVGDITMHNVLPAYAPSQFSLCVMNDLNYSLWHDKNGFPPHCNYASFTASNQSIFYSGPTNTLVFLIHVPLSVPSTIYIATFFQPTISLGGTFRATTNLRDSSTTAYLPVPDYVPAIPFAIILAILLAILVRPTMTHKKRFYHTPI